MRLRRLVKESLRRRGYDLHRITRACGEKDAFAEQKVLLSGVDVRTILDVGANAGQTAVRYRSLFPAASVYSFEPFPETFAELVRRFERDARVKPIPQAVGNRVGTETFYVNKSHYTNSLLPCLQGKDLEPVGTLDVPMITIDEFCEREGLGEVDILKMDIQGGELMALEGAAGRLRRHAVALIYTEILFSPMYEGQAFFHDVSGFLHDHGYSLFDQYNFSYKVTGGLAWGDAIFISPHVAARGAGRLRRPVLT